MTTSTRFWQIGAFRLYPVEDIENHEGEIAMRDRSIRRLEKNQRKLMKELIKARNRVRELEAGR